MHARATSQLNASKQSVAGIDMGGILVVCFVLFFKSVVAPPKFGPYRLEITAMSHCEDSGTNQIEFPIKLYKRRDLPIFYNGTIKLGVPFDENLKVQAEGAAWGNQGYRRRSMQYTFKGCKELMKYFGPQLRQIYSSGGYEKTDCPFPAMDLHLKGVGLDYGNSTYFKTFYYNKYKATYNIFYDKTKVGCFIVFVNVLPLDDLVF